MWVIEVPKATHKLSAVIPLPKIRPPSAAAAKAGAAISVVFKTASKSKICCTIKAKWESWVRVITRKWGANPLALKTISKFPVSSLVTANNASAASILTLLRVLAKLASPSKMGIFNPLAVLRKRLLGSRSITTTS